MSVPRPSRGFLAALGGLAITAWAWYSSSIWPAWPALAILPLVGDHLDPSSRLREAVVVFLIVVNVTVWALVLYAVARLAERARRP